MERPKIVEKVEGGFYAVRMAIAALMECIDDNLYEWPADDQVYPRIYTNHVEAPVATEEDLAA